MRNFLKFITTKLRRLADGIEPGPLVLQEGDRVLYQRRRWITADFDVPEVVALTRAIGSTPDEEMRATGTLLSDSKGIAYIEDDDGALVAVSPARILRKIN